MSELKAGDVVQLKSGGPKMTVQAIRDYSGTKSADCRWFAGTELKEAVVGIATLELAGPASGKKSPTMDELAVRLG